MALYGRPKEGWLDLSTGINPIPYPASDLSPHALTRLPHKTELTDLIGAARAVYRVPAGVSLVATPGTEIAVRLIPLVAPPGEVAVVSPTYGSHAEAWRNAGHETIEVATPDAVPETAAFAIVGNPNNPDGRTTAPELLANLAWSLGARGGFLLVDEAFADVDESISLFPHLRDLPALVLRSIGKFYGLAGLRLGFVAGPVALIERLESLLGDWPISGPALAVGTAALSDENWRRATRTRLKEDAARLRRLIAAHGLAVRGSADLFVLVESANAPAIHRGLAERGIWTRAFDYNPSWLRVGLPGNADAFDRLNRGFTEIL